MKVDGVQRIQFAEHLFVDLPDCAEFLKHFGPLSAENLDIACSETPRDVDQHTPCLVLQGTKLYTTQSETTSMYSCGGLFANLALTSQVCNVYVTKKNK